MADRQLTGRLWTILRKESFRFMVDMADVICGIHPKTGAYTGVFYGRDVMERIVETNQPELVDILDIPVDPETDDIEVACALVQVVKGAHCYKKTP